MKMKLISHCSLLTIASVDEILKCDHSNERIEQYFPVALFINDALFFSLCDILE